MLSFIVGAVVGYLIKKHQTFIVAFVQTTIQRFK